MMLTLDITSICVKANELAFNLMKTNTIKFSSSQFLHLHLITESNSTTISKVPEKKFLGVLIDDHLNWKYHILKKLSASGFVIRQLFYLLNLENL